jgi:uncharacterized membrane protein
MTIFALLVTLAAIGISETSYLISKRRAHEKPVCMTGESCQIVLHSKYATMFGIGNDVLGLGFYLVITLVSALVFLHTQPTDWWLLALRVLVGAGSVASLFLTYLQARVIRAWCSWCLLSACTIWLMALLLIIHSVFPSFLSPPSV